MSVFDLKVGESGVVAKVEEGGAAYKRLSSLGFRKGAVVSVLAFSVFRSSVLVGVGCTRVAIRRAVAEKITLSRRGEGA